VVFLRVHTMYLSADNVYPFPSLSVVSYDGNSANASDRTATRTSFRAIVVEVVADF